jgi:hypothetical protein
VGKEGSDASREPNTKKLLVEPPVIGFQLETLVLILDPVFVHNQCGPITIEFDPHVDRIPDAHLIGLPPYGTVRLRIVRVVNDGLKNSILGEGAIGTSIETLLELLCPRAKRLCEKGGTRPHFIGNRVHSAIDFKGSGHLYLNDPDLLWIDIIETTHFRWDEDYSHDLPSL